jgi:Restriction endonuclease
MDLISPLLRNDFREFCVSRLVLRQIQDIFTMAGIKKGGIPPDMIVGGQRRAMVEEYYATINWHSEEEANKFLKVIGYTLAQSSLAEDDKRLLRKWCEREDLILDGINIFRKPSKPTVSSFAIVAPSTLAVLKQKLIDLNGLEAHNRGFVFEKLLADIFEAHGLAPRGSFRLVGEQIDGSFIVNSDTYLLEAKWQAELTSQSALLIFREKVESKATWARGLFVSNSGFTQDGLAAFARGRATNIIGMTGQDLYFILSGEISLVEAILKKARRATETGEFFISVYELMRG